MFLFSFYRVTVLIKKKPDVHSREKVTLHLEYTQITLFHFWLRNSTFETLWWLLILKKVHLKQFLTHDHWLTVYHIKLCKSFKKLFQSSNVELGQRMRYLFSLMYKFIQRHTTRNTQGRSASAATKNVGNTTFIHKNNQEIGPSMRHRWC